jgi:ribosome-associated toxin RatA of RatAB toxin-antitoxin module
MVFLTSGHREAHVLIEERIEFVGDPAVVWKRVSDIERIPEFWHGTKSLHVVEVKGDTAKVRARFAFGGARDVEITTYGTSMTLTLTYTSGPFRGVQTVRVVGNTLEAKWDIDFKGIYRFGANRIAGHFRSGTVHALERLVGVEAEVRQTT